MMLQTRLQHNMTSPEMVNNIGESDLSQVKITYEPIQAKIVAQTPCPELQPRKRKVTFCKTLKKRLIPCNDEYTEVEVHSIWWTNTHIRSFRKDGRKEVSKSVSGDASIDLRGLERFTKNGRILRRMIRSAALSAVLDATRDYAEDGFESLEDFIARRYRNVSLLRVEEACAAAREDEMNVFSQDNDIEVSDRLVLKSSACTSHSVKNDIVRVHGKGGESWSDKLLMQPSSENRYQQARNIRSNDRQFNRLAGMNRFSTPSERSFPRIIEHARSA